MRKIAAMLLLVANTQATSIFEELKWEDTIQSYLNNQSLELNEITVTPNGALRDIVFTYDVEIDEAPGRYLTYKCEGSADAKTYTIFTATCKEITKEPILIDEP